MTIRPRQTRLQPAVTMCGDGELWEFSFTGMRPRPHHGLDLAPANSQRLIKLHSFIETLRLQSLVSCSPGNKASEELAGVFPQVSRRAR